MKRQKGLNRFRFVTISMVAIGVGFVLFSLIYSRHDKEQFANWLDRGEKSVKMVAGSLPSSNMAGNKPLKKLSTAQDEEDTAINELIAWLESIEETSKATLSEEADYPEIDTGAMSGSLEVDSPEQEVDSEELDALKVKLDAIVTQVYESAEKYLQILHRRKDLSSGLVHLYPDVDPVRYPGRELREYIQAQVEAEDIVHNYLRLTDDFDAFNPGGWINDAFSGMVEMSASPQSRTVSMGFTDEMISW